jgi:2'-5' RNA ligase
METHRAFLALDLSREVRGGIMELEERVGKAGADVKLVEMDNLHVTMKFLGEIGAERVEAVHGAMKTVREKPFQLEARGTGVFPNPRMARVLWVGVGKGSDETVSIFRQLESGLVEAGFPSERNFTPHITIGRVKSLRGAGQLMDEMGAFQSTSFGITLVDRVVLKKSQLTPSGPIYSNLLEVDLRP